MSFQNPAGLWLLLGVPVLIVIWLIRPPYEKKVVSSTYLWQLSERFMKKHLPLHRLTRWLSFLMQLMLIVGSAFYAAQPMWNHGDRVDYLVILDSTASMQMVNADGMTRYERAAQQIMTLAGETSKGHTISILLASDVPEMILTDAASAADVRTALDSHPCGYGSGSLSQTMPLAQLFMDEHPGGRVMLYTDQTVTETEGLTLVSLNENEWNAAMTGISVQQGTDGKLMVSGVVVSYEQDVEISVGVKVDGVLKDAAAIACAADEPTAVSFIVNASAYETIELYMEPKDALTADNIIIYCKPISTPCSTLLVSQTPLYLQNALTALDRGAVDVVAAYSGQTGYDLYIFDGTAPAVLPDDGAVWLIDPASLPDGLQMMTASAVAAPILPGLTGGYMQRSLLKDAAFTSVSVASHSVATLDNRWETILTCGGNPVLTAMQTKNGHPLFVQLFDLHDSNLPMQTDFLILLRNMMTMAQPPLIDATLTAVGESVQITLPSDSTSAQVKSPDGTAWQAQDDELLIDQPGLYSVTAGNQMARLFAAIPPEESTAQYADVLTLTETENTAHPQATSEMWTLLAVLILLLMLTEWRWYLHEQS